MRRRSDRHQPSRFAFSEGTPDEDVEEIFAHECDHLQEMRDRLSHLGIPDVNVTVPFPSFTLDETMQLDELVTLRRTHQTRQAEQGIRTRVTDMSSPEELDPNDAMKKKIRRRMFELLRNHEEAQGVETGIGREFRWRKAAKGGHEGVVDGEVAPEPAAGTAANAAEVATTAAKKVCCTPGLSIARQLIYGISFLSDEKRCFLSSASIHLSCVRLSPTLASRQ